MLNPTASLKIGYDELVLFKDVIIKRRGKQNEI